MQDYFQIYDLNFNPIPLPVDELGYGLRGLDLIVSSIGQEVTEHSIAGMPGNIITGVRDADRDMTMQARIKAMNPTDYRLKRDRVYSFFKELGAFYVTESHQMNKLMKVRVVNQFTPERPQNLRTFATVDIPLKIDGKPYWISRSTTMDLHNNKGIPANGKWSFGMGLDVTPDNLIYQYENQPEFTIYNAGRFLKTVQEKDNCEIKIEINEDVTSFMLYDDTGRYWEYNPSRRSEWAIAAGDEIIFNGHDVRLNGTTIMERTNRYYFVLNRGINRFRVMGLSNHKITFDFRFKYN
jgi:phage-related protein